MITRASGSITLSHTSRANKHISRHSRGTYAHLHLAKRWTLLTAATTVANFAAYTFAPPILVTPLGALSVIIGATLASFFLGEHLGHLGRLGCTLCVLGSLVIVLHAPLEEEIKSVEEFVVHVVQPPFLFFCFVVLVFTLVMIFVVAPKYGRIYPLVYISICSLVGAVSVMAIKGFGIAVKLTFGGSNQFTDISTYIFGITVAGCIVVQMNYFNKALDTFSTNVYVSWSLSFLRTTADAMKHFSVNPTYYVCFSTSILVASIILFQGFNTDDPAKAVSLLTGFAVTFMGVHILNHSRMPEPIDSQQPHSALERGIMNPRLSLQGRMSIDGWAGIGIASPGGPLSARGNEMPGRYARLGAERREHDEDVDLHSLREESDGEEESYSTRPRLDADGVARGQDRTQE